MKRLLRKLGRALKRWLLTSDTGAHVTRYEMYRQLAKTNLKPEEGSLVLNVSHSDALVGVLGLSSYAVFPADYPNYDLRCLPFSDESFDYVVADQVLEHVDGNPFEIVAEIRRVLKPGGTVVLTSCFINPIHEHPGDYWRFTPQGLHCLFRGWTLKRKGGWGNRLVWVIELLGLRFVPIPNATWHPMHLAATFNEVDWPIVVWIVATK